MPRKLPRLWGHPQRPGSCGRLLGRSEQHRRSRRTQLGSKRAIDRSCDRKRGAEYWWLPRHQPRFARLRRRPSSPRRLPVLQGTNGGHNLGQRQRLSRVVTARPRRATIRDGPVPSAKPRGRPSARRRCAVRRCTASGSSASGRASRPRSNQRKRRVRSPAQRIGDCDDQPASPRVLLVKVTRGEDAWSGRN